MQILPPVGRQLAGRLKTGGFGAASLFRPDLNIRLGTYYLRTILDSYDGSLEAALAAYNGGKTRVDQWRSWGEFREPAEFIETIPITETRNYVQAVLRNAWLYRRIYIETPPSAPAPKTAGK
jgi:soluble lytic murein transglycosylase